jgi:hypothetical protein
VDTKSKLTDLLQGRVCDLLDERERFIVPLATSKRGSVTSESCVEIIALNHEKEVGAVKLPHISEMSIFGDGIYVFSRICEHIASNKHVYVYGLPRTGINHLLANLHYNDGIFSFSERTAFPGVIGDKDVFGDKSIDSICKMLNSQTFVWKSQYARNQEHYLSYANGAQDKEIIFYFRHPYMTLRSTKNAMLQGFYPYEWWGDDKTVFNRIDMISLYTMFLQCLDDVSTKITPIIIPHNQMLKDKDKLMRKLCTILGAKYDDNAADHYIKNYDNDFVGYGNYKPKRVVLYDDERSVLEENKTDANSIVRDILVYARSVGVSKPSLELFSLLYEDLV